MKYFALILLVVTVSLFGTITPSYSSWWKPADINQDFKVDMNDVDLCLDSWKSNSSDSNWNSRCDIAESYGIIDIYDFVAMARHYGEYDPIIPEFPFWAILPLLIFATFLTATKFRRKKIS